MKKLITLLFMLCYTVLANASTAINSATVSGEWTLSGSPYLVYTNIAIPADSLLTIDPGVQVIFQGFYGLTINGQLIANGTPSDMISFQINDTAGWYNIADSAGGWSGISISATYSPLSSFQYCNISDTKINGAIGITGTGMTIDNCNFFHHNGYVISGTLGIGNYLGISNCNIHDNNDQSPVSSLISFVGDLYYSSTVTNCGISHCNIYNNTAGVNTISATNIYLSLMDCKVYNNNLVDTIMGAIISFSDGGGLVMGDSIYQNTSLEDGVLSCYTSNVDINRNFICNNQTLVGFTGSSACGSTEGGGGIRLTAEGSIDTPANSYIVHNNIIANNYAALNGGAIYVFFTNAIIINNQIFNNSSPQGGGIYIFNNSFAGTNFDTLVIVKNNIFYNNVDLGIDTSDVYAYLDSTCILEFDHNWTKTPFYLEPITFNTVTMYTLIGDTTTNIIGIDPGVVAPTLTTNVSESALTANFALLSTSPCINMGDTTGINTMLGYMDYAGNYRIYDGGLDIGAYEYGASPIPTSVPVVPGASPKMNVYPNPAVNVLFIATPQPQGTIDIMDMTGKTIFEQQVVTPLTSLDIRVMPRGIYLVSWSGGSGTAQVQKIVIQ